jgi:hypothetical protein
MTSKKYEALSAICNKLLVELPTRSNRLIECEEELVFIRDAVDMNSNSSTSVVED